MFDTLNDDDVFFSEFEGGKQELERIVAAQLPVYANRKKKSKGKAFKLPSKTSVFSPGAEALTPDDPSDAKFTIPELSENVFCYPQLNSSAGSSSPPQSARSCKPSTALSSGARSYQSSTSRRLSAEQKQDRYIYQDSKGFPGGKASQVDPKETCWVCPPRSLNRVCCAACRAKTQQACSSVLRRDNNVSENKEKGRQLSNMLAGKKWNKKETFLRAAFYKKRGCLMFCDKHWFMAR